MAIEQDGAPDGYGWVPRRQASTAQAKEEDVAKTARDVMAGDCERVGEDDIATHLEDDKVAELVEAISATP